MSYRDVDILDRHAYADSIVHRLDPRAKLVGTFIFIVVVVSHSKYAVAPLVPFVLFPVALTILGFVPLKAFFKRLLIALPFVALIGLFNPLLDRAPLLEIGRISISGGWVSFASISLRGLLCVAAVIALIGTTSFARVTEALRALKVPKALVIQLMLLYRYLFVLIEEGSRMRRARALRASSSRVSIPTATSMISVLLLRTMDRADSIWIAMKSRGFNGELKSARKMRWRRADTLFLFIVILFCVVLRFLPVTHTLGGIGGGL